MAVKDASVNGKVDMAIQYNHKTFIFEFNVVKEQATGKALQQIIDNNCAEKYRHQTAEVWGIGVEFSKTDQQIVAFETQQL